MNLNKMKNKKPKIVASIEARMSSTRLPGKVLADLNGAPALTRLLRRLRHCKALDDIILATSNSPADDALEQWAKNEAVNCYRGSEDDVLLRVVEAHRSVDTDIIVEITGDCILTDPEIVDMAIATFINNDCDVVTNCFSPSFPRGLYAQVFWFSDLEKIEWENKDAVAREHVSSSFYDNPTKYRIIHMVAPAQWLLTDNHRIYLDYPEDLEFLREVYKYLEPHYGDQIPVHNLVEFLRKNPKLNEINQHCTDKPIR